MDIKEFQSYVSDHTLSLYDTFFSMNALAGELGELANEVKKETFYYDQCMGGYRERVDREVAEGIRVPFRTSTVDEAGDVLFYLLQVLNKQGIGIQEVITNQVMKMDELSKQHNRVYKK